jgi:protein ImuA
LTLRLDSRDKEQKKNRNVVSRVAEGLSLVAGDESRAAYSPAPGAAPGAPLPGARWPLPAPPGPTMSELFAASPRDAGWVGFLLAQAKRSKPLLWVQERMAILESGRIYPPGLGSMELIHVEARDARAALWAMEEGLRCSGLSGVIGELWGDPQVLDFTATRRLAVAAERSHVPCWLVRLGGTANLSGARMRWRIASGPSIANPFDTRAPGASAWDAELFRARGAPPGHWAIAHEADSFHLVAAPGGGALGEVERLRA